MTPQDWQTLQIMATVFTVGCGSMVFLESRFRKLERAMYRELSKRDTAIYAVETRAQRLELHAFGFTKTP